MQQMYVPPLTYTNKLIIIFAGSFFFLSAIVNVYGGVDFTQFLALTPARFFSGHIHQIITYSFVQTGLLGALFNCLIVWFIGGDLELNWGRTFYRKFLAVVVIGTGAFFLIISLIVWGMGASYPFLGLEALCLGLLVAYAMVFPDRHLTFMFLFPMKAKYFCMILCVIELYSVLVSAYSHAAWGNLFAMAISYVYLKLLSQKSRGKSLFSLERFKKKKQRPKLSIVKDTDDEKPKYWH